MLIKRILWDIALESLYFMIEGALNQGGGYKELIWDCTGLLYRLHCFRGPFINFSCLEMTNMAISIKNFIKGSILFKGACQCYWDSINFPQNTWYHKAKRIPSVRIVNVVKGKKVVCHNCTTICFLYHMTKGIGRNYLISVWINV